MAQCFARDTVLIRDRTTDFADDFQFRRIFAGLLSALSRLFGDAANLAWVGHVDENAVGNTARESGHFGAECCEIDRNDPARGLERHFKILRGEEFSFEAESVAAHRCADNFDILFHTTQRTIEILAMPLGYRRIGGADAE